MAEIRGADPRGAVEAPTQLFEMEGLNSIVLRATQEAPSIRLNLLDARLGYRHRGVPVDAINWIRRRANDFHLGVGHAAVTPGSSGNGHGLMTRLLWEYRLGQRALTNANAAPAA